MSSDSNPTSTTTAKVTTKEGEVIYQPTLEENPKWELLIDVLREIEQEDSKGSSIHEANCR